VICRRTLPLVSLPNDTVPVHLRKRALVLRRTRLEQFSHTRQTARDVAGLLAFDRDAREHLTRREVPWPSRICTSEPTGKPIVTEWSVPGIFTSLPATSSSFTCGRTTFAAPRRFGSITTSVDRPVTYVELLRDRDAFLDVLELRLAGELGDDRAGQRIPGGEHGAGLELLVGLDVEQRTVRHLVTPRARGYAGRR